MDIFTRTFVKEFRSVMSSVKAQLGKHFNLASLEIPRDVLLSYAKNYVRVQGVKDDPVYMELNGLTGFIYGREQISDKGGYAFSNVDKTLSVGKDYIVFAVSHPIRIPNRYKAVTDKVRYLGFEKVDFPTGVRGYLLFAVHKELIYPVDTFVVTIGVNNVREHLGGVEVMLTNGFRLYIVVQERNRIRNTEQKNMYQITTNLDTALSCVNDIHAMLVFSGKVFNPSYYNIEDEFDTYNLVYKPLEATTGVSMSMEDLSLKDLESRRFELNSGVI